MAAKPTISSGPCDLPSDISDKDRGRLEGRKYEYQFSSAIVYVLRLRPPGRCAASLIQIAGGDDLSEAFEQVVLAMFGYMTDLNCVESSDTQVITAEAHDLKSLLYHFMDEWLFIFSADPFFIPRDIKITEFDRKNFKITSVGYGETFDLKKHPQGTEVKAITYSNMQIYDSPDKNECYVIIDI